MRPTSVPAVALMAMACLTSLNSARAEKIKIDCSGQKDKTYITIDTDVRRVDIEMLLPFCTLKMHVIDGFVGPPPPPDGTCGAMMTPNTTTLHQSVVINDDNIIWSNNGDVQFIDRSTGVFSGKHGFIADCNAISTEKKF